MLIFGLFMLCWGMRVSLLGIFLAFDVWGYGSMTSYGLVMLCFGCVGVVTTDLMGCYDLRVFYFGLCLCYL